MKEQTRSFLEELYNLMMKYEVDIEVSEDTISCGQFKASGFEVSVVNPEEGYSETIYIYSKFLDSNVIKELLND